MEEQDAYILGVDYPVKEYKGKLIAIINRKNDVEDKWVISNQSYSLEEIEKQVSFTEQYFDSDIILIEE
jgi:inorganic pyrophosphatase